MRKILTFAEHAFTVISLLHYSGGPLVVILSGGANENEFVDFDSSLIKLINFLIYTVTFFLLVLRWKKVFYAISKDRFILLLPLLALVSIVWSFEPSTTLRTGVTLIGSSLFGLYLATRYSLKQQLYLLVWTFGIAVVLSFIFAVALPKYGVMGGVHAGKWRGIYLHKNGLGAKMVISSIIFFIVALETNKNRWVGYLGLGLSLILLVRSASTSSLLNLVILIAAVLSLRTLRLRYHVMIPALITIATVGGSLFVLFKASEESLFGVLGKDSNLTGRGDMWPYVLEMIWQHPWLGYGYGGFWQGLNGESAYIWRATGWTPTHPHNGFLALWLDLGLLGLSIYFLGFAISLVRGLAFLRLSRTLEGVWPVTHMTFMMLANLTESQLLDSNNITWILYVAISLSLIMPIKKTQEVEYKYSLYSHLDPCSNE